MHVPPSKEAVRDLMPAFFEQLAEEKEPAARVVLGHFIFVYIHPYFSSLLRWKRPHGPLSQESDDSGRAPR